MRYEKPGAAKAQARPATLYLLMLDLVGPKETRHPFDPNFVMSYWGDFNDRPRKTPAVNKIGLNNGRKHKHVNF